MLWTLLKVLVFVAIVAALAFVANHLIATGEGLRVVLGDTEFTMGLLTASIVAVLLLVAAWLLFKLVGLIVALLRFLNGDETAMTRYLDRSREKRGFEALADGILALTAGEGRLAFNKALRAEKLLQRPELTDLIIAPAAEQVGDTRRAEEAYKRLLTDDRTRFVGVRGLLKQKLAEGDTDTALKLAEKAFAMRPKTQETQDILLKLQSEGGDWAGARRTLEAKQRAGALPRDVYKRRDAVMALLEAREIFREGNSIEAREAAITAARKSPDLIPAVALAARGSVASGDAKSATRLLRKAWEQQPHPDLAAAYAEIVPDETPAQRLKRFGDLVKANPDHPESRMLMAELDIAAEDFPAARRSLGDLPTRHPTARVMAIMAAVERGEGASEDVVRGWLARALTAPRGPQWVCDNCQAVHASWAPICANCHGFDTLSWREPPEGVGLSATQAELLPVLVRPGAPRPAAAPEPAPEAPPPAEPASEPVAAAAEVIPPDPPRAQDHRPAEPAGTAPPLDLDALRRAEN